MLALAEAIKRARGHPTLQLDVALVTRALTCPRCSGANITTMRGADLDGMPARRCKDCGAGFRVLVVSSADVVAAIDGPKATDLDPGPATVEEAVDFEAENGPPDAEDRELARNVLRAWRVRLAAIHSQKRMADDVAPLDEDLALLERALGT